MRMHRPADFCVLPCGADHLVNGKPGEGLTALTGENMGPLGFLFTLQPLQPNGLIAFEVMGTVDRALEPPDGDGAFSPIDIVPTQVNKLADPEPVQERL